MRSWRHKSYDDFAVSPVVATILLVAITVILVGILYVWVSSMMTTAKTATPTASYEVYDRSSEGYFEVHIVSISGKAPSISDVYYRLYDKTDALLNKGSLEDIYETTERPGVDEVAFIDRGGTDGRLNYEDYFIINSTHTIEGTFELIYRNTRGIICTAVLHAA
jgi:flagellin-like protein